MLCKENKQLTKLHSDLVTGNIQVNQVKRKLQAGQDQLRQSKPHSP